MGHISGGAGNQTRQGLQHACTASHKLQQCSSTYMALLMRPHRLAMMPTLQLKGEVAPVQATRLWQAMLRRLAQQWRTAWLMRWQGTAASGWQLLYKMGAVIRAHRLRMLPHVKASLGAQRPPQAREVQLCWGSATPQAGCRLSWYKR